MAKKQFDKEELFSQICDMVAEGMAVRNAIKKVKWNNDAFYGMLESEKHKERYARATTERQKAIFEDMIDIADDTNGEPARDRLRLDTRKWMLGKMNPKKYGDKLDVTSDGEKMNTPDLSNLTTEQIKELLNKDDSQDS